MSHGNNGNERESNTNSFDFLPTDSYGVKALASVYVGRDEDKWSNGLSCVSMA